MKKAVFLDSASVSKGDVSFAALDNLLDITFFDFTGTELTIPRSQEAEIIICNKTVISKDVIEALPNLKYIIVAATGYNNIDVDAAREAGIHVSNIRGYSTSSVVQHVYALLLGFLNKPNHYVMRNKAGAWSAQEMFSYWDHSIEEVNGKTIGIFGFGNIGQAVAKVALALGMNVIATHKHPERDSMEGVSFVNSETLFTESDFLTLHAPLNEQTQGIINKNNLSLMKSTAILINTGRGGLINEKDLADALENDVIQAALLDVLCQEPPESGHTLEQVKSCYITPHQAWASKQARERLMNGIVDCVKSYQAGNILNDVTS